MCRRKESWWSASAASVSSNGTVGGTSQDRSGSQISERTFDHGRTFLKRVDFRFGSKADIAAYSINVRFTAESAERDRHARLVPTGESGRADMAEMKRSPGGFPEAPSIRPQRFYTDSARLPQQVRLFVLDEDLVTVRGTDVLGGVRRDDRDRAHVSRLAVGLRGFSVGCVEPCIAIR